MINESNAIHVHAAKLTLALRDFLPEYPGWLLPMAAMIDEPQATIYNLGGLAMALHSLDAPNDQAEDEDQRVTSALARYRRHAHHTGWAWMRPVLTAYAAGELPSAECVRTLDTNLLFTTGKLFKMPVRLGEHGSEHRDRLRKEAARREVDAALAADTAPGYATRARVLRTVAESGPITRGQADFLLAILRWSEENGHSAGLTWAGGLEGEIAQLVRFPTADDLSLATFALFTATELRRERSA